MRLLTKCAVAAATAMLAGCVDPAHSRFANKGPCEVSVGSHICGSDDEGAALTSNGDASLRQVPGSFSGGGGR